MKQFIIVFILSTFLIFTIGHPPAFCDEAKDKVLESSVQMTLIPQIDDVIGIPPLEILGIKKGEIRLVNPRDDMTGKSLKIRTKKIPDEIIVSFNDLTKKDGFETKPCEGGFCTKILNISYLPAGYNQIQVVAKIEEKEYIAQAAIYSDNHAPKIIQKNYDAVKKVITLDVFEDFGMAQNPIVCANLDNNWPLKSLRVDVVKEHSDFGQRFKIKLPNDATTENLICDLMDQARNIASVSIVGTPKGIQEEYYQRHKAKYLDLNKNLLKESNPNNPPKDNKDGRASACFVGLDYVIAPAIRDHDYNLIAGGVKLTSEFNQGKYFEHATNNVISVQNVQRGHCSIDLLEDRMVLAVNMLEDDIPFPFELVETHINGVPKEYIALRYEGPSPWHWWGTEGALEAWLEDELIGDGYTPYTDRFPVILVDDIIADLGSGNTLAGFAHICDTEENFECGWIVLNMRSHFRDAFPGSLGQIRSFLKSVFAHETLHLAGLGHTGTKTDLMYPYPEYLNMGYYLPKPQACALTANRWGEVPEENKVLEWGIMDAGASNQTCGNKRVGFSDNKYELCEEKYFGYEEGDYVYCANCDEEIPTVAKEPGEEVYCDTDTCLCYSEFGEPCEDPCSTGECKDRVCPHPQKCSNLQATPGALGGGKHDDGDPTVSNCYCTNCGNGKLDEGEECDKSTGEDQCHEIYDENIHCNDSTVPQSCKCNITFCKDSLNKNPQCGGWCPDGETCKLYGGGDYAEYCACGTFCGDGIIQNPPEECEVDADCGTDEICVPPGRSYECKCKVSCTSTVPTDVVPCDERADCEQGECVEDMFGDACTCCGNLYKEEKEDEECDPTDPTPIWEQCPYPEAGEKVICGLGLLHPACRCRYVHM